MRLLLHEFHDGKDTEMAARAEILPELQGVEQRLEIERLDLAGCQARHEFNEYGEDPLDDCRVAITDEIHMAVRSRDSLDPDLAHATLDAVVLSPVLLLHERKFLAEFDQVGIARRPVFQKLEILDECRGELFSRPGH